MLVVNISDFTQNATQLLDAALKDDVIINNEGMQFRILPIKENKNGKSPLEDIPRVKLNVTTQEVVDILQECRAGK